MVSKLTLPDTLYAPEQVAAYVLELAAYRNWLTAQAVRAKVKAKSSVAEPPLPTDLIKLINARRGAKPLTAELVDAVAAELKALSKTAPVVHITLATVAPQALKIDLVRWLRTNLRPDTLVGFTANATIGGGMILRTRNHIYDYSFKKLVWGGRGMLPRIIRGLPAGKQVTNVR